MEHLVSGEKAIPAIVKPHLHHKFSLHIKEKLPERETSQKDAELLEFMVENDVRPFHKKSKNDVMIIYDLSQEVYYKHNDKYPELAKLTASLFLFFSDFGYYLNIERQRLIPVVQDLIEKIKNSENSDNVVGQLIKDLRNKIRREHYSVIDKLKYFRILTGDYKAPRGSCKSYKHLFDKLKKFENDLVMYIHFENDRFFPLVVEMENYYNENKLNCQDNELLREMLF